MHGFHDFQVSCVFVMGGLADWLVCSNASPSSCAVEVNLDSNLEN